MNNKELIEEICKKKEFCELPEGVIEGVLGSYDLKKAKSDYDKIKQARAVLRKYFTIFLTNKISKGKLEGEELLRKHVSSKDRDYEEVYGRILSAKENNGVIGTALGFGSDLLSSNRMKDIFSNKKQKNKKTISAENQLNNGHAIPPGVLQSVKYKTIIDFGAGLNGLSFEYIKKYSDASYLGVEATNVLVKLMNNYFSKNKFEGRAIWGNLFDLEEIKEIISKQKSPKVILLFRVIDALELLERDYSKTFILGIMEELDKEDKFVISFSLGSISGKSKFKARRYWLLDFIEQNFEILDDFESNDERFIVFGKK